MRSIGAALLVLGVLGTAWGIWSSFLPDARASQIRRWSGAIAAPLSILAVLVGVVLVVLPDFFTA